MAGLLTAAEITSMTALVASSLDVFLPLYRKSVAQDGYGHSVETYPGTPTSTVQVNVIKPSATDLQVYAAIIGTKEALLLRFIPAIADIREGDRVVYRSGNWLVQNIQSNESYTFANEAVITVIA
jgi:hypothetical protein